MQTVIHLIHNAPNAVRVTSAQEVQNHLTVAVQQCRVVVMVVAECVAVVECAVAAADADNNRMKI
jgi:hypothetical protein